MRALCYILLGSSYAKTNRRASGVWVILSLLLWAVAFGLVSTSRAAAESELPFPRPASLEPNVSFWVDVFTAYSTRDFVVFDRDHVWRIYQVLHLPGSGSPTRDEIESVNAYLHAKYGDMLTHLASGRQPETYEERQVAALFKGEPLSAYADAAQNVRVQEGLRERFRMGLLRSRYYYPTMERIFRSVGLPPELVTLASVESGFYGGARSSAGAVGIWQFTRSTGRHFMKITRYHDDRLNPVRETEAAAKLLRYNYEALGNWPLAITAYDYGTAGTARAANVCGNDYCRVFEDYKAPHFGFASKNYYAEFLAALQVHRYEDKYFPGIQDESVPPPAEPRAVRFHPHKAKHVHSKLRHVSYQPHIPKVSDRSA